MEETQALDPHGTQVSGVSAPQENADRTTPYAGARQRESAAPYDSNVPAVIRPTGVSWVTLALGLLCLGLASLVLTLEVADVSID